MTEISLIVAMADNRVIGKSGDAKLLWHISEDLKRFKTLTTGKPVIMGRKTFDSIGKPLPNRPNIVVTRQSGWSAPGITSVTSLEDALNTAKSLGSGEIMIIGGAQIYEASLPFATRVYLTHIHKVYEGDALFPNLPESQWTETSRETGSEPWYEFITYQRK